MLANTVVLTRGAWSEVGMTCMYRTVVTFQSTPLFCMQWKRTQCACLHDRRPHACGFAQGTCRCHCPTTLCVLRGYPCFSWYDEVFIMVRDGSVSSGDLCAFLRSVHAWQATRRLLHRYNMCVNSDVEGILAARVPIIKFTDKKSGFDPRIRTSPI